MRDPGENEQFRGLRIKSPQALPPAHPVNSATSRTAPERTRSAGSESRSALRSDPGFGLLLIGLGLFAAVVAPAEVAALLRAASRRRAPSGGCAPRCNGTGDGAGCTANYCYSGQGPIDVEAVEVRR